MVADAADGADGVFSRRMHLDDPASGAAFTTEGNLDAVRRDVCGRRRRPASARGLLGHPVPALEMPPLLQSLPARRRSAALPVHELRSAMSSRTLAATGSASMASSIAT